MQTKTQWKEILIQEYLNRFFTFYMSRTHSVVDAEELSQNAACECLDAIERVETITNVNAYFWSVAHHVYKNYLSKKSHYILDDDYCRMQIAVTRNAENEFEQKEMIHNIRKSLSILSGQYRKILVFYYYHEMKIKEIATTLNLSADMVKYYLSEGKRKLKEIYRMDREYGEKSFNPRDFSIYYSGIDFARVNVWDLFRRKLPGQIALTCFQHPRTISELSLETGCSSCYLEEEVDILCDAGVLEEVVKGKYQTHFFILSKEDLDEIDAMVTKMYREYANDVVKAFHDHLDQMIETKIFRFDASTDQYKWIFVERVATMDHRNRFTEDADYPRILSCGARGLVFALEAQSPKSASGGSPTYLEDYVMWARDVWGIQGDSMNQAILREKANAQTVIDVFHGILDDSKEEVYANLIQHHILTKKNGKLYSNIAYLNKEYLLVMKAINDGLYTKLEKSTRELEAYFTKLVTRNIPPSLKAYLHGYVVTLMDFFAGNHFLDEMIKNQFLDPSQEGIQTSYFLDNESVLR